MHILELTKPDGRHLTCYSSRPIAPDPRAQLLASGRSRDRIKLVRGAESGAGMFAIDLSTATMACELRRAAVGLEDA